MPTFEAPKEERNIVEWLVWNVVGIESLEDQARERHYQTRFFQWWLKKIAMSIYLLLLKIHSMNG